jgi:hypothetical protein
VTTSELGRAFHGDRLVGALVCELLQEGIELGLLLQAVHGWGPGGFLLEGEMHALMAAVLQLSAAQPADRERVRTQRRPCSTRLRRMCWIWASPIWSAFAEVWTE